MQSHCKIKETETQAIVRSIQYQVIQSEWLVHRRYVYRQNVQLKKMSTGVLGSNVKIVH